MLTYPIPMTPGPVHVPPEVMAAGQVDYGAADLETEFLDLYNRTEARLRIIMGTRNPVVIHTGEGMIALWGALKSCLAPCDRVLSIATGVFGDGIGEMARSIGAEVRKVSLPCDETVTDLGPIEAAIKDFKPRMITAVHCETPSGTLNPIDGIGDLKRRHGVPLLYVDAVSSVGGTPVSTDEWGIDLCLGGSQKCLSSTPGMAFLSVSDAAWEIVDAVGYVGYDALKPFRTAQEDFYFPYTPNWHGVAMLDAGAGRILDEGLSECFTRHNAVAADCRGRLAEMGLSLFPKATAAPSPTVTAVKVPEGVAWPDLDAALRKEGAVMGGSYGPMAGKVFRLGHMGSQADPDLASKALDALETALQQLLP